MGINSILDLVVIFTKAALVTLEVALASIAIALVIGLVCAIVLYFGVPVLKTLIRVYVVFFRNTPSLIQAYFIFYGLPKIFMVLDSFTCSVIVLSLLGGAYMCEAIFAAVKAISTNQKELALAIGLSKLDTVRYLILPQSISISIAAINNNAIFLTKEVSAMKLILLPEIVYQAFSIISLRPDLIIPVALFMVLSYLVILIPMTYAFSRVERRIRYAEFGN
ncbi:polar amino acid transport system permease protein [Sporobacter termitidis DSM 10068]|uniref:Polar amino acid transport system permease protein n=1 Tax=Sporobacter termitidis DSM 10068 TaxID=1123282 RepID=A0A1M5ZED2_9FIRM|nr:ABC transporter permease subunit [Sporobacter termitidis]SHI22590.1 polar amino acid transport system permease protein [Sporobacter termitidis DSM 10068]